VLFDVLIERATNRVTRTDRRKTSDASFLRGDLDAAVEQLDASITLAERDHWLAFLPWPQSFRGEIQLARGDTAGAAELLRQAFARACQLGDPCWEGISGRGLALVADAAGDVGRAFALLSEARVRGKRLAEPYLWLDGYILDAQCELGLRHGHPDTSAWVETMQHLAAALACASSRAGRCCTEPSSAVQAMRLRRPWCRRTSKRAGRRPSPWHATARVIAGSGCLRSGLWRSIGESSNTGS